MYKKPIMNSTTIVRNEQLEGESIETKVERIIHEKSPIKDGAPLIYTEKGKGVQHSYNPRADRFEIAVEAMDKVTGSRQAKREEKAKTVELKVEKGGKSAETEPTQGKG